MVDYQRICRNRQYKNKRRGAEFKQKCKTYADNRRLAKASNIGIGDKVLVEQDKVNGIYPRYKPEPVVVVAKKGSMETVQKDETAKCDPLKYEGNQDSGHPRTQGLFGKDPGIVWSRDSTKVNCPRGSGKVSNYMLENVTVNFKYQKWDFTIHRSKRPLTSILYFCLLLNYKSTVAFYQQSSQETNKSYTL